MKRIYLDWAAAAPVSIGAKRAFLKALDAFGNPSSPHEEGRAAHAVLEDARVRIARMAGVKADAVIFTAGATEANALAILGQVRAHIQKGADAHDLHVLYLPSAHASTRAAIRMLEEEGVAGEPLSVIDGSVDLVRLRDQIRPETALVTLEAVCGETGARFDVRGVRRVLDDARKGGQRIPIHVDAAQLPLVESFERTRLAGDTLSLDAQKVGGIRGIGVLLAPRETRICPLMKGGGQERDLRPGTEASALAAAFAKSLEDAKENHATFAREASAMRENLLGQLLKDIPNLVENGGTEHAPHILNISLPDRDTDYLAALMNEAGFAVSTRSACATDSEGSVAVRAFTADAARAASTLRISWGPGTRARDLDRFAKALARAVRFLDTNGIY